METYTKYTLILVIFLILYSCSSTRSVQNKITIASNGDPQTLDPRFARDLHSYNYVHLLFDGLFRKTVDGKTVYSLCESFEEQGTHYRFILRESYWSDGTPLTAYDFVKSWSEVVKENSIAPFAYQFLGIENFWAEDSRRLCVDLKWEDPSFIELLTTNSFFPFKENCYSGPFQLKNWENHHRLIFSKNPFYLQNERIHVEEIIFEKVHDTTALHLFEKGELDWIGSPLGSVPIDALSFLEQKPIITETASTRFLRVNVSTVPLELRHALSAVIERDKLLTKLEEKEAVGFLPALFNLSIPKQEVALKELPKTSLNFIYIQHEVNHRVCQLLEQQWKKKLGIEIHLIPCNAKIFYQLLESKQYDIAIGTWYAGTFDPLTFLEVFKYENETGWINNDYQTLLNDISREKDPFFRKKQLLLAQTILQEDLPIIPLYHPTFSHLENGKFQGIHLNPLGILDFHDAKAVNSPFSN